LLQPYRADGTGGWDTGTDKDGDGYKDDIVGWNFVNNTNNPFDDNGHGTHVSGIIGARGNNGVGVAGIDWNVQIIALKFRAGDARNDAAAHGANAANNSWSSGSAYWQPLADAITNARNHGLVVVAVAGNGNGANDDTTPNYPGSYNSDNVVVVAATDSQDRL